MPTFEPTKCRALHEWPLRRAAPQHFEVVANGGKGPEVTSGSKGGKRTYAALCIEVCFAGRGGLCRVWKPITCRVIVGDGSEFRSGTQWEQFAGHIRLRLICLLAGSLDRIQALVTQT
jgi:hypothetical protein